MYENVKNPEEIQWPFHYNGSFDVKIQFNWDSESNEPILLLDGKDHDSLPWIDPSFRLDEQELPIYYARLVISDVWITEWSEPFEWEPHVLEHRIFEKHGTNQVNNFEIGF